MNISKQCLRKHRVRRWDSFRVRQSNAPLYLNDIQIARRTIRVEGMVTVKLMIMVDGCVLVSSGGRDPSVMNVSK
jgi:hypothetical protein